MLSYGKSWHKMQTLFYQSYAVRSDITCTQAVTCDNAKFAQGEIVITSVIWQKVRFWTFSGSQDARDCAPVRAAEPGINSPRQPARARARTARSHPQIPALTRIAIS